MESKDLPKNYLEHVKEILGEKEFNDFHKFIMENEVKKSVTFSNKATTFFINENLPEAEKIELAEFGYYIPNDYKIGDSLLNHAGVIYSQDSSSMIPVELLGIEEGDFVLDLCAAPGGKSIQILNKLNNTGLLVSNEIEYSRAKILFENITRMGFKNSVITNSDAKMFAKSELLFDKILVDAPCSGEGLVAKAKTTIDWKPEYVVPNAERQLSILNTIKSSLKNGGVLVYSTCTFNTKENEEVVFNFLKQNPEFELVNPPEKFSKKLDSGISVFDKDMSCCLRCYPHKSNGSGQFVAILRKNGEKQEIKKINIYKKKLPSREHKIITEFLDSILVDSRGLVDNIYKVNSNIYLLASELDFNPINILCNGCVLGEMSGEIIKPNHCFFKKYGNEFKLKIELDESSAKKYIKGEQLEVDSSLKGYGVFLYKGFVLGGFKTTNGRANNLYPKNLRV